METDSFRLRPAGRHILTIGRDLIQDQYAAIVELVKNAYDADSPDVYIKFSRHPTANEMIIVVEDSGHGMTRETVINKWLVPSTDDKLKRRTSPNGRSMQGRKGVGRYAASILGDNLLLETVTSGGEKTTVFLEWKQFTEADYLNDVEILVDSSITKESQGTKLTIAGSGEYISSWNEKQIQKLKFELKKLISPVELLVSDKSKRDSFRILLSFYGLDDIGIKDEEEFVEPYPIVDLYDYKISGVIDEWGNSLLKYTNQKARNTIEEEIKFSYGKNTGCGNLHLDIRVYDRDSEAIDMLIKRGLKDERGNYVGKLQARQLLNESNGIGVYRNGFRIRPLGDAEFDWLKLNDARVQNPSLKVGGNQVIGYVQIESEELSNLEEKSARDGLKENIAYENLKDITKSVISQLEQRRYVYRQKEGLGRTTIKVERELEKLFEFDELKREIRSKLTKNGIDTKITNEIIQDITDSEEEKNRIVNDVKNTVAIYQGQATLGKIVNVILHEGRRPLNYFKTQIPNFNFWMAELKDNCKEEVIEELIPIANGISKNSEIFVNLFGRIDPLASGKRSKKDSFFIYSEIELAKNVFEQELLTEHVDLSISGDKTLKYYGWKQDIYIIVTNLIDNSLYWMSEKSISNKSISIEIFSNNGEFSHIDYRDTGPGIENHLLENEVIFDPEFTTKMGGGSGLGLAIAGEAAMRNRLELKAFASNSGAYFRLQLLNEE